jgi:glyoxylase-like metal-dependent hydrolase (beta-lactamase superfamily II)
VTYSVRDEATLLSGDVLFQGSIGRTDLPGGDTQTLLRSIAMLLDRFDDATLVLPGHMGTTTLGAERATNPFLTALAGR